MDTTDKQNPQGKRLIEVDFPLKQTSLDSVHEKNVRHGHISTLHIWPARRPLAASRAALITTLLPDPGNDEERKIMMEKLAGRIVEHVKKKKLPNGGVEEQVTVETEGGILHWGRESGADLQWFRDKIREAYGGRVPRVLDPFAGGGAIPLEAMRLGCEVTAADINPVAWFILKCTLEYPQRLANQLRPLPAFACESREFMESYFKAKGFKGAALEVQLTSLGLPKDQASQPQLTGIQTKVASIEADLAWHIRAWGWWVLQQARADLAHFYPNVDGKPTVAYLWARTIICKNCRATVPLLKTRWLSKKDNKRVVLTMEPNANKTGVVFGIQNDVPSLAKSSAAQKREHDKKMAGGTMSRSGVTCPCCNTIMTMEDIRGEAHSGRLGAAITAVVVDGDHDKEYRMPTEEEMLMATEAEKVLSKTYAEIPFGLPNELTPTQSQFSGVANYSLLKWSQIFTSRQLLTLGTLIKHTRVTLGIMARQGYSQEWIEAQGAFLAIILDRTANYMSTICIWEPVACEVKQTFLRFALPITWDFAEANPLSVNDRFYNGAISNVGRVLDASSSVYENIENPTVLNQSAIQLSAQSFDVILTDPP